MLQNETFWTLKHCGKTSELSAATAAVLQSENKLLFLNKGKMQFANYGLRLKKFCCHF